MSQRLPPLNALRAFEAAARNLSFKKAAEELHVTGGAISHQVKTLEDYLGVQLFRRLARGLELTEAAETSLPKFRDGFDSLAQAVELLRNKAAGGAVSVHAAPSFTTKWLVPRLSAFADAHPEIDLRITASLELTVLRSQAAARAEADSVGHNADLMIRYSSGNHPEHDVQHLCSPLVAPLCSPRLLETAPRLTSPDDLREHTLLHDETVYFDAAESDWRVWLRAAGVDGVDVTRGPRFSHAALAIDAAGDALGVALSLPILAAAEIAAGRLVIPFEPRLPCKFGYYLLRPKVSVESAEVAKFGNWLLEEVRRDEAQFSG